MKTPTQSEERKMKKEIRIEVVRHRGEWKVEFGFGNQSFILEYGGTKAEANWNKLMLKKCFANYKKSLIKSTEPNPLFISNL